MRLEAPSRVPLPSSQLINRIISFDVNLYLNWKSCRPFQGGTKGGNYTHKYNIDGNYFCPFVNN